MKDAFCMVFLLTDSLREFLLKLFKCQIVCVLAECVRYIVIAKESRGSNFGADGFFFIISLSIENRLYSEK